MASAARSIKLSPDLAEVADLRARQLGYASLNAYVKSLIRYDAMVQGDHQVTRPITHLRLEQQDKMDAELLDLTKAGVGVRGQWLENAIRRVAGEDACADDLGRKLAREITQ